MATGITYGRVVDQGSHGNGIFWTICEGKKLGMDLYVITAVGVTVTALSLPGARKALMSLLPKLAKAAGDV